MTSGKIHSLGRAEYKVPDDQLKSENKIRNLCVWCYYCYCVNNHIQSTKSICFSSRCLYVLPGWLGTSSEENCSALHLTGFIFSFLMRENRWGQLYSCKTSLFPTFPLDLPIKMDKKVATSNSKIRTLWLHQ